MNQAASKKRPFRKRLLPALLRRTKWIGIRIDLFITVREGETPVEIAQPPRAYNFGFLTEKNIEDLKGLQPRTDPEKLHTRFREGKLCFGVRDNSRLIAKMWCDLNEFNYPANYRKLAADEVYLYSAFVDPEYRGHGLAPLMRAAGYASLRELGRSKFYSCTLFFNTASRRFKAKLGAREESLRAHLKLFGKWSTTVTLRHYN